MLRRLACISPLAEATPASTRAVAQAVGRRTPRPLRNSIVAQIGPSSISASRYQTAPSRCFTVSASCERQGGKKRNRKKGFGEPGPPVSKGKERAAPTYNFELPEPTSIASTVKALSEAAQSAATDADLAARIAGWGIRGEELETLHSSCLNASSSSKKLDDTARILGLLSEWEQSALADLRNCAGNYDRSSHWDIDNTRHGYEAEGESALKRAVVTSFLDWLEAKAKAHGNLRYLSSHLGRLRKICDSRTPMLEYARARTLNRRIHLHVGPTNSGKTHGALVALCKAKTGIYAGPLRLLAHEVWDRINNGTVSPHVGPRACNLVTGEEVKIMSESATIMACTVEMTNMSNAVDVAVIDEIQMIADKQRGWSWTAAVMGIPALELHLCGEASVVPLIKEIAKACGDTVEVHEYQRLSPLAIGEPLRSRLSEVRKGDCVVAFSRNEIFNLKAHIEEETGLKCALAYGALPPETKAEQAKLFNDPDNDVDVMIASDAIGMGLNLKIKRIVFHSVTKYNGREHIVISASQIKQIAGRAGRYGTNMTTEEAGGLATTMSAKDIDVLKDALAAPLLPVTRGAMQPSLSVLSQLSTLLPPIQKPAKIPGEAPETMARSLASLFSDAALLMRITSSMFFVTDMEQQTKLAPVIESALPSIVKLTLAEREQFANSPTNTRDPDLLQLFSNLVRWYAKGTLVHFEDVESGLGLLDALESVESLTGCNEDEATKSPSQSAAPLDIDVNLLMSLETLHRGLTLFMWLSNRFPLAFCFRSDVEKYKARTETAIDAALTSIRDARRARLAALGRMSDSELMEIEREGKRRPFVLRDDRRQTSRSNLRFDHGPPKGSDRSSSRL